MPTVKLPSIKKHSLERFFPRSLAITNSIPIKIGVKVPFFSRTGVVRKGPLLETDFFNDTKDPCPVFDGQMWHLFGSGGSKTVEVWKILHATSSNLEGPWEMQTPTQLIGVEGPHVAAPGVIYDSQDKVLHMFIQTDFMDLNTSIEHLTSIDGGKTFTRVDTALTSIPDTSEAGIYDPHPALIQSSVGQMEPYLVYTGVPTIAHGDIYLAKSVTNSWDGPWKRLGPILTHDDVPHHNPHTHEDYEWGLEGAQLIQLPNGNILLNSVCFLPDGPRGSRQRVFFAIADTPSGPYRTLGPVIDPIPQSWESGENGHATALIHNEKFYLFYQARSTDFDNVWRYGLASWKLAEIQQMAQQKRKGSY